MGLDELRARLDSLLANLGPSEDRRARASGLYGAMVEFKTAIAVSREARVTTERELAAERRQLEDAARRGALAQDISDAETARIALEFVERHRERTALLERKLAVVTDEIAYMEREYAALAAQYQSARQTSGLSSSPREPDVLNDREFDALKARADRETAEMAVKAQLELLKRKLNKP
jgi:hypothetical protein